MAFQSVRSPNFKIFETPNLWVMGQNDIWMQPPWLITTNIIRQKVVASLEFGLWWILWVRVCPWLICASKVLQPHTNQLVVWFVLIINLFVILLNPHPRAPTRPSIPEMLRIRERTPILSSFVVFTFELAFESFKECGDASLEAKKNYYYS
jgi:hypothetical protein